MALKRPQNVIQKKIEVEDAAHAHVYSAGHHGPQVAEPAAPTPLFLVGLRGSGKSTVGRAAAQALGREFLDTDLMVEEAAGKSIAEIVKEGGWEKFRDLESEALKKAAEIGAPVVATGGGMVLRPENRALMREKGKVAYLMAPLWLLQQRLEKNPDADRRPPLTGDDLMGELRETFNQREPLYMEIVDFILYAEKPVEELVEDVKEKLALMA